MQIVGVLLVIGGSLQVVREMGVFGFCWLVWFLVFYFVVFASSVV